MKRHRCMRCGEEFDCPLPAECTAEFDVLPNVVRPVDGGLAVVEHCPVNPDWDWIRAYGKRRADAARSAP